MKRKTMIVVVTLVAVAAGTCVAFMVFGGESRTIDQILKKYEFTELDPPGTLAPPRTLVRVKQERPLVIGIICASSARCLQRHPIGRYKITALGNIRDFELGRARRRAPISGSERSFARDNPVIGDQSEARLHPKAGGVLIVCANPAQCP
jgi:hypothetical protein